MSGVLPGAACAPAARRPGLQRRGCRAALRPAGPAGLAEHPGREHCAPCSLRGPWGSLSRKAAIQMEIRALHPAGKRRRRRRVAGSSQTARRSLGDFGWGKGYRGTGMEEGETLSGTYTAQVDAGRGRKKPFASMKNANHSIFKIFKV